LRPKPVKPATNGFETQTTKPPASSVLHTHPPTRHVSLPSLTAHPPSPPKPRSTRTSTVLTQPTWSLLCTLAQLRLSMSQMLATTAGHPASLSLSLSLTSVLHHFRSIGTARPYLTFTSPSITAFELQTCTPPAKRHNPTHAMVSSPTQPRSWITLTITYHKMNYKGTYQPCVCKLENDAPRECMSLSSRLGCMHACEKTSLTPRKNWLQKQTMHIGWKTARHAA
jgi:hypothetical protein